MPVGMYTATQQRQPKILSTADSRHMQRTQRIQRTQYKYDTVGIKTTQIGDTENTVDIAHECRSQVQEHSIKRT